MPCSSSARARPRVRGEDDRPRRASEAVDDAARAGRAARWPRGGRSRRRSALRLEAERLEDARALARERGRTVRRRRPSRRRRRGSRPRRPRPRRIAARALVGREAGSAESRSTSIRLRSSGIVRSPLRSPASTCATGTPASRPRAPGERRVRVAVDEHRVGRCGTAIASAQRRLDRRDVGGAQVER